jgi:hypothetical protein
LSHLTFKLVDRKELELTAIYRSHYYIQRALGNLIGLAQLMRFVALEAGLKVGRLTCISTDAHLDVQNWGGTVIARALVAQLKAAADAEPAPAPGDQMSEDCAA